MNQANPPPSPFRRDASVDRLNALSRRGRGVQTLGSSAGNLCVPEGKVCVGIEINANHVRAARSGVVTGTARPVHVGGRTQVWEIRIEDEAGELVCISRLTLAVVNAR